MSDNFSKLNWEYIEKEGYHNNSTRITSIKRAKVFGGWLIEKNIWSRRPYGSQENLDIEETASTSITFLPDENHIWNIEIEL